MLLSGTIFSFISTLCQLLSCASHMHTRVIDLIARKTIRQYNDVIGRIIRADFTDGTTLSHAPNKLPASPRTYLQPAHDCQVPRKKWKILKHI